LALKRRGVPIQKNWLNPREDVPVIMAREAETLYRQQGMEIQYLPLLEEIKRCAREDSFIFAPIWGKMRRGKSSLGMWLLYYIYGSWDEALRHLVFTLPDVMEMFIQARKEKREIPLLVWDDIAVHGGKRTKSGEKFFRSFSELFDAVGTVCHGLLATCIRPDDTVPALRQKYLGEVVVEPRGFFRYISYDWRLAYYLPAQPYFVKILVEEANFSAVPDEVYARYKQERNRLLDIKMAEVYDMMYLTSDAPIPELGELEVDALKRIADHRDGKPLRDDMLKETLYSQGYGESEVIMTLAKLESQLLAVKRGRMWVLTPRGRKALEQPVKAE
jgi:hypothetical protein